MAIRLSKEKISLAVFAISIIGLVLIVLTSFDFSPSRVNYPLRIERRVEAMSQDGNYSYQTNKVPYSFKFNDKINE